jgi:DNA-binding CsgD family transcriptional regulator
METRARSAAPGAGAAAPPRLVVGREAELATIDRMIAGLLQGRGRAAVLRGEPGVGKTTLLTIARERAEAAGVRVLHTTGVEAESGLPYGGVERLLAPVADEARGLTPGHAAALRSALGRDDAGIPDAYIVALAALELLAELAQREPVLLIADDAQWLDRNTRLVLAFIGRRAADERIAILAGSRRTDDEVADLGLDDHRMEPLAPAAAEELLDRLSPQLAPAARGRILALAQGNPLALAELPHALTAEQRAGATPLPDLLALTGRLEAGFAARAERLPEPARLALLAAALAPRAGAADVLAAVAEILGAEPGPGVLAAAVAGELIEDDPSALRFRHPLMRSAIQQAAGPVRRQAMHAALARTMRDEAEALWHRARATQAPDEDLATRLQAAGERALRRGAPDDALRLVEQAATVSAEPGARVVRLRTATELAFELGRVDDVRRFAAEAQALDLPPIEHARVRALQVVLDDPVPGDPEPARELIALADAASADGRTDVALRVLAHGSLRCWWASPGPEARRELVAAAQRVPADPDDPRVAAIIAEASPIEDAPEIRARLDRWRGRDGRDAEEDRLLATAAYVAGDYAESARRYDRALAALRRDGRLALLARALVVRGWLSAELGEWTLLEQQADEALRLAHETAQPIQVMATRTLEAIVAGARGDRAAEQAAVADAERLMRTFGLTNLSAVLANAQAFAAAATGRWEDVFVHTSVTLDDTDPYYNARSAYPVIPLFAEAASRTDRVDHARTVLAPFGPIAERTGAPDLRAALAHAAPFLAGDAGRATAFERALAHPAITRPFDHARLLLSSGMWLRRRQDVPGARERLQAALTAFERLDNRPYAALAEQELRATGAGDRERAHAGWYELSPQESHIARLVAAGLTNREIAERLFVSHRTVASHLYRIFPKLGVTSRAQVRGAMPEHARPQHGELL